ncbi:MAG TPA: glycosyltransferase family 4 protein [Chloroflexia bacterium]|nr:glycosyltransferase family 4 protein [Chloroflexia bacterium]
MVNPKSKIQNHNNPHSALRVLWIWHAAVVAEYQKPLDVLGRCADLEMAVLVPRRWPERAGQMVYAEGPLSASYRFIKARTLFTGFYYVYFFPSLLYHLLRYRPHIIYCYEEAHTFISACVLLLRRIFMPRTRVLLYAAQNIKKRYPLPFRTFERYCFRRADSILACGSRVAETLRSKGYRGDLRVVPLPTDTRAFSRDPALRDQGRRDVALPANAFVIGYAGKLVEEKGVRTLWAAFAEIALEHEEVHLALAGGGPLKDDLLEGARRSGLAGRLHLPGVIHNDHLPAYMNALDVFVLPSETRPNWREQFGRVLVEAMACGVPVIGSDSGEIPEVVGDAGLIFHEGDVAALASHLRDLLANPASRADLSQRCRERVLNLFTLERVAAQHHSIYQAMSRQ